MFGQMLNVYIYLVCNLEKKVCEPFGYDMCKKTRLLS